MRIDYLSTTRQKFISFWLSAPTALTPLASLGRGKPISCSWRHSPASSDLRLARQDSSPRPEDSQGVWAEPAPSWSSVGHGVQFSRPVAPREVGLEVGDFFLWLLRASASLCSSEIMSPTLFTLFSSPLLATASVSTPSLSLSVRWGRSRSEEMLLVTCSRSWATKEFWLVWVWPGPGLFRACAINAVCGWELGTCWLW